jgi:hypothetical protein
VDPAIVLLAPALEPVPAEDKLAVEFDKLAVPEKGVGEIDSNPVLIGELVWVLLNKGVL